MRKQNRNLMPLFLVTLPDSEKSRGIFKLTKLCFVNNISFEPLGQPKKSPLQCFKCQRFHHVSSLCHAHASARCVKCCKGHETQTCEKPKDLPATCVNCWKSHTANYRGCEIFKKIIQNLTSKKNSIPQKPKKQAWATLQAPAPTQPIPDLSSSSFPPPPKSPTTRTLPAKPNDSNHTLNS